MTLCPAVCSVPADHDDDRVRSEDGAAIPEGGESALSASPGPTHHRLVLRLCHRLLHHRHSGRRLHLSRAPQHRSGRFDWRQVYARHIISLAPRCLLIIWKQLFQSADSCLCTGTACGKAALLNFSKH